VRKISTCYLYLHRHYYDEICNNPTFTSYDALCTAGSEGGKNSSIVDKLQDKLNTQVLTPLALMWGGGLNLFVDFFLRIRNLITRAPLSTRWMYNERHFHY